MSGPHVRKTDIGKCTIYFCTTFMILMNNVYLCICYTYKLILNQLKIEVTPTYNNFERRLFSTLTASLKKQLNQCEC
jgi:hypothetical protein